MYDIYLDNIATTKPYPEVVSAVASAMEKCWGNPSSRHAKGRQAHRLLEESRIVVAEALRVDPDEVYFTSGGTESNNLGIQGACWAAGANSTTDAGGNLGSSSSGDPGSSPASSPGSSSSGDSTSSPASDSTSDPASGSGSIITSTLEHASVTKTVRSLKRQGWHIDYIDAIGGDFDLAAFERALSPRTTLITVMTVQNELGYRFPLKTIARLRDALAPQALFHTDAVQAFGRQDFFPREIGCDLASISAHKLNGPKGVGALYVKRGTRMFTTAHGGGQERWLRSGTEGLPLIAGFAQAVQRVIPEMGERQRRVQELYDSLLVILRNSFSDVVINSREDGAAHIINFTVPGVRNNDAVDFLSDRGIYLSTASACENNEHTVAPGTWREKQPLILQAAGISLEAANSTFRLGLSPDNSEQDCVTFVKTLQAFIASIRP